MEVPPGSDFCCRVFYQSNGQAFIISNAHCLGFAVYVKLLINIGDCVAVFERRFYLRIIDEGGDVEGNTK